MAEWKDLTQLTQGSPLLVERVRLPDRGVAIEGSFALPPLAQLPMEDQVFIGEFIKSHGSIKEMERLFGISYPTVKNRLNKIASALGLELQVQEVSAAPEPSTRAQILGRLERGEITPQQAIEEMRK